MITGRQPDSGKPTVRDERGACGNVGYGGGYTGTYSGNAETAKPQPKVARAAFLPDSRHLGSRVGPAGSEGAAGGHHHLGDQPAAAGASSAEEHGNVKTRGVHANQVFAAIFATMRMLNLVIHWSVKQEQPRYACPPAEATA